MMRRWFSAAASPGLTRLPLDVGIGGGATDRPVVRQQASPDVEALEKAVRLPYLLLEFVFRFSSKRGFTGFGPPGDTAPRITAIRKRLGETSQSATKAGLWFELGTLYQEAEDEAAARKAFLGATATYRSLVAAHPSEDGFQRRLGEALFATDKTEEAESVLRSVVKRHASDAEAWNALAYVLLNRAFVLLWPPASNGYGEFRIASDLEFEAGIARLLRSRPSPDAIALAERLYGEAGQCFDRGVAAAPDTSSPYLARAAFRVMGDGYLRLVLRHLRAQRNVLPTARGQNSSDAGVAPGAVRTVFSEAVIADLWQAARHSADSPDLYGMAALIELCRARGDARGLPPGSRALLSLLDSAARGRVEDALAHVDALKRNVDARTAARAWAMAGALRHSLGDPAAEADLRQALQRNPQSALAWDMLTSLLLDRGRVSELVTLYEARLRHEDAARSRIILAKLYDRLDQPDKVRAQVEAARRQHPEDPLANLAMAAILLKSRERAERAQALGPLDCLERQQRQGLLSADLEAQFRVLNGIALALTGKTAAARREFEQALVLDRENAEARQALVALPPDTVL